MLSCLDHRLGAAKILVMDYEQTHPWLLFSLSLSSADSRLWLLLGEVASKVEHLSGVPLRPDVADELHRIYLAKGALAPHYQQSCPPCPTDPPGGQP
jgi:hypothetical protein